MTLREILKNWKHKSRITKTFVWLATVLLLVMLTALPNLYTAFGFDNSQVILAQTTRCRRAKSGAPRNPNLVNIPYLISPRRTLLLTDKPKLRWNLVPGVKQYTASLVRGNKTIWQTSVNQNEVIYPGTPKLEPGVEYLLVVNADNGKSSQDEEQSGRGFRLLPAAEVEIVKATLNNQQITDKAKAITSAYIYNGFGLKAEAIETLSALVAGGIKEATLYKQLGELYWQTGVNVQAEINYLQAVKLAAQVQDPLEQAHLSQALGEFYIAIAEDREAIKWFIQARDSHKTLGNTQQVKELDTEIGELKSGL